MKNYYRILGLNIDAEHEEIKAAYRILAQRHHPDKGGSNSEFMLIQEAYSILINPHTKKSYDKDLLNYLSQTRHGNLAVIKQPSSKEWLWLGLLGLFAIGAVIFGLWAFKKKYESNYKIQAVSKIDLNTRITPSPIKLQPKPVITADKSSITKKPNVPNEAPVNTLSGIHYIINLGSYDNIDSAHQRQKELMGKGFTTKIQKVLANSEGNQIYNVYLGPYQTIDSANSSKDQLTTKGVDSSIQSIDFE